MMMSAKDLQTMGFGRGTAYRLLRGDIVPVVTIGKRRFIRQTTLLDWLDEKEKSSEKKAEISSATIFSNNPIVSGCVLLTPSSKSTTFAQPCSSNVIPTAPGLCLRINEMNLLVCFR